MHQTGRHSSRWETHTWIGSGIGRYNEDFTLVDAEGACAVLVDGATGLTKANVVAGESDASWYARTLCHHLVDALADKSCTPIAALCEAGHAAADAYRRFSGADQLARIDEPNGSVAFVRWLSEEIEVVLLGDCTAAVTLVDGSVHVLHDDTLTRLDDENYERMYAYATSHHTTMAQARKALNPRFVENRLKMNEPGGYWAADISCRGMEHAIVHRFDARTVVAAFACSDGFAASVDMGVCDRAKTMVDRVVAGEGVPLGEELRTAEQQDAGCWRVHRSKTSDDATYFCVWFAPQDL